MKPKTEELLNFLLWSADSLLRPTFRNLTGSYESWAYSNGLLLQASKLERRKFLERDQRKPDDRVYRLTEEGRLHALGGRDPETQWKRPWDGRWRVVLFDVPRNQNSRRERLRRYLRSRGFGCLQGSVWVSPDSVDGENEMLEGSNVEVQSLLLLEARPAAGESDFEIVSGAWDFECINRCYDRHLAVLRKCPRSPVRGLAEADMMRRWAGEERSAWLAAVNGDPLLPQCLLPDGYLGIQAWSSRKATLRAASERLKAFNS